MHMVIRAIVYAENKSNALSKANHIFDGLCGEDTGPFDYYTTFDDNTSQVSGKARWGEFPVVAEVDSKEGKKLIADGMKYTKDNFMAGLKIVRKVLKKSTNKQIYENNDFDRDMIKYRFHCLGEYKGPNIFLYDCDGEGIRTPKHLEDVLGKWKCVYEKENKPNPNKDLKIYVVPADVHY